MNQEQKTEQKTDEPVIPDLWHIAMSQRDPKARQDILNCWYIAHELKKRLYPAKTDCAALPRIGERLL